MTDNELLQAILEELKALNSRLDKVEDTVSGLRLNSAHPLVKLLFR